jgi:SAM-dependent methyltransferase
MNFNVPWPSWRGEKLMGPIDLSKPTVIDYLDCPEAEPLRTNVIDLLKKNNCKNVVDVGCGDAKIVERINFDNYMGFDSAKHLIKRANRKYKNKLNHEFRITDWDGDILVDFEVDCLLFIGTLSYNDDHVENFERLCELYRPRVVIIQEILQEQTYVAESNQLKAMPLDYYQSLPHTQYEFDLPIWCGHRMQLEIFPELSRIYNVYANNIHIDMIQAKNQQEALEKIQAVWGDASNYSTNASYKLVEL